MLTETVREFDGLDIETPTGGGTTTVWGDPAHMSLARDRSMCIVHLEIIKIGSANATVALVAEDSSGRIFGPVPLTAPFSGTAKGVIRVIIKDFGANLKFGVSITRVGVIDTATVGLEYCFKNK